jgi:hypothetical protein
MAKGFVGQAHLPPPWAPTVAEPADISAIKALVAGNANEAQQLRAVEWLKRATAVGELEFRPDSDRATAFAAGKRFVAIQFFTLAQA